MWTRVVKNIIIALNIIISIAIIYMLFNPPHSTPTPAIALPNPVIKQNETMRFPYNGKANTTWDTEAIAEFKIHAENTDTYHYIKLENIENNSQKAFIYIHPKSVATVKVPLGEYNLYMASGNIWYGEDLLFGNSGTYKKAIDTVNFYKTEHEDKTIINGKSLTLKTVTGNLNSRTTSINDFK